MTRLREVPNCRELERRDLQLLGDKLVFLDLQLLDFRVQRRSGNSEFRCGTLWAGDFASTFRQGGFNNLFFLILESIWQRTPWFLPAWGHACQPGLFDPKGVAAAQDHR